MYHACKAAFFVPANAGCLPLQKTIYAKTPGVFRYNIFVFQKIIKILRIIVAKRNFL